MHNELINYNSDIDLEMENHNFLVKTIQNELNLKHITPCVTGVPKRDNYVKAAETSRPESMNELNTQKMSVMFSSSDFVHHFILYKMDDGRIADVYIKLTADKKVDVFEYTICVEH